MSERLNLFPGEENLPKAVRLALEASRASHDPTAPIALLGVTKRMLRRAQRQISAGIVRQYEESRLAGDVAGQEGPPDSGPQSDPGNESAALGEYEERDVQHRGRLAVITTAYYGVRRAHDLYLGRC